MDFIWTIVFLALFLGFGVWSSLLSRRVGQLEDKLKGADKPVHSH